MDNHRFSSLLLTEDQVIKHIVDMLNEGLIHLFLSEFLLEM